VLQEIVVTVGNIAPSTEIYDNNTWHDSNYGILAKFIMGKSDSYSKFESLNSVVYNLAEKISNHKAKFDEAFTQAVFNLTKSFLKSQLMEKVPTPAEKGSMVIKKIVKVKTVRKSAEFDVSKMTKKMVVDFTMYCGKVVKNMALINAGLRDHAEELAELDILK
jgi:hypothetical protein